MFPIGFGPKRKTHKHLSVLESTEPVTRLSEYVRIDENEVERFCSNLSSLDVRFWMDTIPFSYKSLSIKEELMFIFVFNSINFCYWGDPKWTIEHQGKSLDGAWGMIASLRRALEDGVPLLDSRFLSEIDESTLEQVFRGNKTIPLFAERLRILREVGNILGEKYNGDVTRIVERAEMDILRLLGVITTDFPSFYDGGTYKGQEVIFHKRAQLAIADFYRTFKGKGFGKFSNISQLTAFADYKIPQVLRKLGLLEYSQYLASKVDSKIEIPTGSPEELEIRASTIWAIELIRRELEGEAPGITAMDIDSYLWVQGQQKGSEDKPYHLTRTTAY